MHDGGILVYFLCALSKRFFLKFQVENSVTFRRKLPKLKLQYSVNSPLNANCWRLYKSPLHRHFNFSWSFWGSREGKGSRGRSS